MPLPSVHFRLARGPLSRWSLDPASAPFDPAHPRARNAYFSGALAPDMGLFPGGEPILSELAHTLRPGDLARAVVYNAANDVERGFAWGWVTHVLADAALHPLINMQAARLVASTGGDPSDAGLIAAAHARAELGLDVHIYARDRRVRMTRLRRCFDSSSIGYLAGAYRATYGLSLREGWLLRSHRAVGPLAAALGLLESVHAGSAHPHFRGRARRRLLDMLRTSLGGRLAPLCRAFLHPLGPTRRLLGALRAVEAGFTELVCRHQREGLVTLGNADVDGSGRHELLSA